MPTTDDAAPLDAVPDTVSPPTSAASTTPAAETDEAVARDAADDALSPAVRRLVRQFDLDITSIHGTGPDGRIRVSDVMSLLKGRTDSGNRDAPQRMAAHDDEEPPYAIEPKAPAAPETPLPLRSADTPASHAAVPTSSIFECDFGRVLSHRQRLRRESSEQLTTTSYVLAALASALESTPELAADWPVRFGVWLAAPNDEPRCSLVDVPNPLPTALEDRARAFDAALRADLDVDISAANLLVHSYGESGSLLVTPTPIGAGHVASIGIGRVRRELVVRLIDGVETPRVAARCYLSVSFFEDYVEFHRASRALADAVRMLENWPD